MEGSPAPTWPPAMPRKFDGARKSSPKLARPISLKGISKPKRGATGPRCRQTEQMSAKTQHMGRVHEEPARVEGGLATERSKMVATGVLVEEMDWGAEGAPRGEGREKNKGDDMDGADATGDQPEKDG